jgi:dTDP-4-dehydrorhamnose reductase
MIVLLGASGFVGSAFRKQLDADGEEVQCLSRKSVDYTCFDVLYNYLKKTRPEFLVNAAGYTGKPNVDACELDPAETVLGNAVLPATISHACSVAGVPWGHVSSGCIYSGGKLSIDGCKVVRTDLMTSECQVRIRDDPDCISGFNEEDQPNFDFRSPPCSFYSGTKSLGEEALHDDQNAYMWRLRIPFNNVDTHRNYLGKLMRYDKLYQQANSLSHLDDYVKACLALWRMKAPFGVYNMTNPGHVFTHEVVGLISEYLDVGREFTYFLDNDDFYQVAKTPRSSCILDVSKLLNAGVRIRGVKDALRDALSNWRSE